MSPIVWALRPLKQTFVYSGRAPRAEYWWFYLATIIVGLITGVMDGLAGTDIISGVVSLLLLVPTVSVSVRRLHDIDRTGWWLVLLLVPLLIVVLLAGAFQQADLAGAFEGMTGLVVAGFAFFAVAGITLLIFMVTEGTEGPNKYGPDPYGTDALEEVFA